MKNKYILLLTNIILFIYLLIPPVFIATFNGILINSYFRK